MFIRTMIGQLALVLVAAAAVAPADAQNRDDNERQSRWSSLLNVDLMVNTYSRFLARKYDLTEEQDEFTRQFLREQANVFMDQHRDEVTDLVDRMFEVRTGGQMDQTELVEWGKRIAPIYQEAKQIIVMGNSEWREILTEDQKRIHDEDVKLMLQSFETTEDQLERIVTGQMTVDEFRKPTPRNTRRQPRRLAARPSETDTPRAEQLPREPQRPPINRVVERTPDRGAGEVTRPDTRGEDLSREQAEALERLNDAARAAREMEGDTEGDTEGDPAGEPDVVTEPVRRTPARDTPPPPRSDSSRSTRGSSGGKSSKNFESEWETYTRTFIDKYKLDEAQTQKALAILSDCQEQGRRHMAKNESRIEDIDKQLEALKTADAKERRAKTTELNDKRAKLREPIDRIFEKQLKPRLEKLPTRAQRKEAESGSKKPSRKPSGRSGSKP